MTHDVRTRLNELRKEVVGIDTVVPLLDGTEKPYVFLDNAASTPTFRSVVNTIEQFLPWYAGVHRGVGLKAVVATNAYDEAHRIAGEFAGADLRYNTVVFVKNTTEAVNKLAYRLRLSPDDVVLTTVMEHHSNDLPWRRHCRTIHVEVHQDGTISLDALAKELTNHRGKVRIVAVSGASNVTGICNPIHAIAEMAHAAGAKIFVDAAQLVAHRPVSMLPQNDPRHIDFLAYSAHKIYAPFGIGVLIGPAADFANGEPDLVGGGTVSYVGAEDVDWAGLPHKEEAGSPNVIGAIALAKALLMLKSIGMDAIREHETHLLEYALSQVRAIRGVRIYGPTTDLEEKVGVIPFTVDGVDHALVATILSVEGGIGVRNGNFCAQPYMRRLLNITPEQESDNRAGRCDSPVLPGMVRASLGCYNNEEDIDRFVEMLERIARFEYRGNYHLDPITGMYVAEGFQVRPQKHFGFFDGEDRRVQVAGEELA